METRIQWRWATVVLLVFATALACNREQVEGDTESAPRPATNERYGMVVFLKGSEFFNWAFAGMKDAAAALDPEIDVELQGPAEWDATLQARAVDQLAAKRVDGIVLTAGEPATLIPAINNATRMGIPVVTFDSDSPDSSRLMFIGTDNHNAGYEAGKAMAGWLNGQGKIGISTFLGPDHLKRRVDGFRAALAEIAPDIEIVATVNDEGDVAKAETQITAMLQANPDIAGIFAAHGNPGPGAAAAVRKLGVQDKVQIMAFDFGMPVVELIEKGEIRGTVGQNPYLMGYMAMMAAYAARHGTELPQQPKGTSEFQDFLPPTLPKLTNGKIDTGVSILYKQDMSRYRRTPEI